MYLLPTELFFYAKADLMHECFSEQEFKIFTAVTILWENKIMSHISQEKNCIYIFKRIAEWIFVGRSDSLSSCLYFHCMVLLRVNTLVRNVKSLASLDSDDP